MDHQLCFHLKKLFVFVSQGTCVIRAIDPFWKVERLTTIGCICGITFAIQATLVVEEEVLLLHTTCLVGKHKASLKKKKVNQNYKRSQHT